jgi:membrane protease YdiL (CAAX protease family)
MIGSLKSIYIDLFSFIKNPKEEKDTIQTAKEKANKLFAIILINLIAAGIFMLLIEGLKYFKLVDLSNHAINEEIKNMAIWQMILVMVIVIPFIEELLFRGYLRYKKNYLLRFIVFLTGISGESNRKKVEAFVKKSWIKNYRYIYYFSAILFGSVHIFNFEITTNILLFAPILVGSQLVAGILIGYLRVRHNLYQGFYLHAINNFIFMGIALLTIDSHTEVLNVDNKEYSISISELNFKEGNSSENYSPDSIVYRNVNMHRILSYVLDKNQLLIKSDNAFLLKKNIDLVFKNKANGTPTSKKIILKEISKVYNLTLKKETLEQEVWKLKVCDSLKLMDNIAAESDTSTCNNKFGYIYMGNKSISELVIELGKEYDKLYIDSTNIKEKFNFEVSSEILRKLRTQLSDKYGISLTKDTVEMEFIKLIQSKVKK